MSRMYLSRLEKTEIRRIVQEKTGYVFRSSIILDQIFRRSSLAAETGESSNEIFEFIGDQVLSFYVVKIVSNRCGSRDLAGNYTFKIQENRFTRIKQALVNNETLANIIDEWDIAKYLLLGRSDIKNDVTKEPKVKADLFEAIIGAIAIESRWNSEILESVVSNALRIDDAIQSMIESDPRVRYYDINMDNAVSTLKEMAERGECTMPKYGLHGPDYLGHDENGNPIWWCNCQIINDKTGIAVSVKSTSKKEAKRAASYVVLCRHLDMQNKYGPSDSALVWTYKNGNLLPEE